jgi:hypothetical protein
MAKKLRGFDPEKLRPLDDQARAIALAELLKIPAFTGITTEKLWTKIGRALWEYVPPWSQPGRTPRSLELDQRASDAARQIANKTGMTKSKALRLVVEAMQKQGLLSKHTTVDSHLDQLKPKNLRKRGGN